MVSPIPSPGTTGLDGHILTGQAGWRSGVTYIRVVSKIIATEDKEEPVGRREVNAYAQLQPCQDLPSFLKEKSRAISDCKCECWLSPVPAPREQMYNLNRK